MAGDNIFETIGNASKCRVPAGALQWFITALPNHRIERAAGRPNRRDEMGRLGTNLTEIRRMARVAPDFDRLAFGKLHFKTAADAAVGAVGFG